MSDRKPLPGKFVWFELVSSDARKAQSFYGEVLGWKAQPFPMGDFTYEMILTGDTADTMIGGYAPSKSDRQPSHWISYVSVEDVDATVKAAIANGGKVVEAPSDLPGVGRKAGIADPQGAELYLLKNAAGDRADAPAAPGQFFWNELHTSDPTKALAFYEKVLGFSHRSMDMGPAGTYYILSRGGVDRGGVTSHLPAGVPPHWLPYVAVDDPDATIALARKRDAKIPMAPRGHPWRRALRRDRGSDRCGARDHEAATDGQTALGVCLSNPGGDLRVPRPPPGGAPRGAGMPTA